MNVKYLWLDRKYLVNRQLDRLLRWAVWHLPRKVVMLAYTRVAAHATTGKYGNTSVADITMLEALKRWDDD